MRLRPVRLISAGLLALSTVSLTSCDDANAAARMEAAAAINQAASDTFLAGSNPADLKRIVGQLKSVSNGTKEQMATRDRLLASIQLHLAIIQMSKINAMEVAIRHDLLRLRAKADVAARLSTFAETRERADTLQSADHLNTRRDQISSQLEQVRQQTSQMEEPVRITMEFLQGSAEEVARLLRQASRLREEAGLVGPLQRFPKIEEAIDLERQADRIEAEMMRKELTLELAYRPAKSMFDRSQVDLEEMLEEIKAAHGSLQQSSQQANDAAAQARGTLNTLDAEITLMSRQISDWMSGELSQAYEQASRDLRTANANARKAGRGGDGRLAKDEVSLLTARIELAEADLWTTRVHGLDEWIRMLELLASNDEMGNRDAWKLEADEARSQRDTAAEEGTKAIDAVLQSASRTSTFQEMQPNLEANKAYLAGEAMPALSTTTATTTRTMPRNDLASSGGSSAASSASARGIASKAYASPQDLVAAFNAAASSGDGGKLMLIMMASATSSSPAVVEQMRMSGRVLELILDIQSTAKAKFGGTLPPELEMGMGMLNMLSAMRLDPSSIAVNGDRATVNMSIMGQSEPGGMVKTPEGWMIDGDEMAGQTPGFDGGAMAVAQLQDVLTKLQNGTISTQDQLNQAMSGIDTI
ncbi:MAG: hypothetical protein MK116_04145 [Phycisphaerales bacterium]|nr:hypothetical protein [Phycisphaerales bacterium]